MTKSDSRNSQNPNPATTRVRRGSTQRQRNLRPLNRPDASRLRSCQYVLFMADSRSNRGDSSSCGNENLRIRSPGLASVKRRCSPSSPRAANHQICQISSKLQHHGTDRSEYPRWIVSSVRAGTCRPALGVYPLSAGRRHLCFCRPERIRALNLRQQREVPGRRRRRHGPLERASIPRIAREVAIAPAGADTDDQLDHRENDPGEYEYSAAAALRASEAANGHPGSAAYAGWRPSVPAHTAARRPGRSQRTKHQKMALPIASR